MKCAILLWYCSIIDLVLSVDDPSITIYSKSVKFSCSITDLIVFWITASELKHIVIIEKSGTYKIKLRRWPEEIHTPINSGIPARPSISGTTVTSSDRGKALKISKAAISIQGIELSKNVVGNPEFIEFEVKLKMGKTKLQTFFTLEKNETIGAYYVSVEKI